MTKIASFIVKGRGRFPVDMLRFDCAWPRGGDDAEALLSEGVRAVRLRTVARTPTVGRWASFGWTVTEAFDEWGDPVPTSP